MAASQPIRNIYIVLVHEEPECVKDIVENLTQFDEVSIVLLYDGSTSGVLNAVIERLTNERVIAHPCPRPVKWGRLHEYFADCIEYLQVVDYDVVTIVDSDQLMLRKGFVSFIQQNSTKGFGLLSSDPSFHGKDHRFDMAICAHKEAALWNRFLSYTKLGPAHFAHWTFWPSTVISKCAATEILYFLKSRELRWLLSMSKIWASEEILIPTLVKCCGFSVDKNPTTLDWIKWQVRWSLADLSKAVSCTNAFFIHPVPRIIDHPLRAAVRNICDSLRT